MLACSGQYSRGPSLQLAPTTRGVSEDISSVTRSLPENCAWPSSQLRPKTWWDRNHLSLLCSVQIPIESTSKIKWFFRDNQVTNENQLYIAGNSTHCSVVTLNGKETPKRRDVCIHIQIVSLHQTAKLMHRGKATNSSNKTLFLNKVIPFMLLSFGVICSCGVWIQLA